MIQRESRGELLRLICMLMIVMHHFAVHCLYPHILTCTEPGDIGEILVLLTHAYIFIGVNCFILLSGFYGIRVSIKSFFRLYMILSFYAILTSILGGGNILCALRAAVMPFSALLPSIGNSEYWFIKDYIALYFISPILNVAKENMNEKHYATICVLLLILQVYFGDITSLIDTNRGYSLLNFILLYMIGGYLNRFFIMKKMQDMRNKSAIIFICAGLLWGFATIMKAYNCAIHFPKWHPWAYNNIIIIITSVAFFMFAMSFSIKSKIINWLASSCLAVYIIQENYLFDYKWFASGVPYFDISSPAIKLGYWICISVLFMISALLLDKIRVGIQYPINILVQKIEQKVRLVI